MSTSRHAEPDTDLYRAHLAGDPQAFEALYARYRVPTYAYLLRHCGSAQADASFRALWREAATSEALRADHGFVAKLFALAHAEAQRVAPDGAVTPESTLPDVTQRTRHRAQRFQRSLRQVAPSAREAYLLYEEGGLTLAEVGDILGVDAEVARERVRRALTDLRGALETPGTGSAALHDPQVAAAHLAARPAPTSALDAVVLDEARRAAQARADAARATLGWRRHWRPLLLVGAVLVVAQGAVVLQGLIARLHGPQEIPLAAPIAAAPPPVPSFEALPVAAPVQAPKLTKVVLGPKPAPKPAPKRVAAERPAAVASPAPSVVSPLAPTAVAPSISADDAPAPSPASAPLVEPAPDDAPPPPR